METKMVILAGLIITCTTVLRAQDASTNAPIHTGPFAEKATVAYREILWTNGAFVVPSTGQLAGEDGTNWASRARAGQSDLPTLEDHYQVIVLPPFKEEPSVAQNEEEKASATETNNPLQSAFTADGFRSWNYQTAAASDTERRQSRGPKEKPVQIIVIEPLNASTGIAPDSFRFREYLFGETEPEPVWYEWFDPRLFIPQWVKFWMTETNATPADVKSQSSTVVLILYRF